MASRTRAASVPSGAPGASRPPAVASRTSGPPMPRASSATPSASLALWETITIPITVSQSPRGSAPTVPRPLVVRQAHHERACGSPLALSLSKGERESRACSRRPRLGRGPEQEMGRGGAGILVAGAALPEVAGAPLGRDQRDGVQHPLVRGTLAAPQRLAERRPAGQGRRERLGRGHEAVEHGLLAAPCLAAPGHAV